MKNKCGECEHFKTGIERLFSVYCKPQCECVNEEDEACEENFKLMENVKQIYDTIAMMSIGEIEKELTERKIKVSKDRALNEKKTDRSS